MRRLIVVLVLACGLVPMLGGSAFACGCPHAQPWATEELGGEYVAYVGTLRNLGDDRAVVTVERRLKGSVDGVRRVRTGGMCGAYLKDGRVVAVEEVATARLRGCGWSSNDNIDTGAALLFDPDPRLKGSTAAVLALGYAVLGLLTIRALRPS